MKIEKNIVRFMIIGSLASAFLAGCGKKAEEAPNENVLADNIIITETGEVLPKQEVNPELNLEEGLKRDQDTERQKRNVIVTVQAEDGSMKEVELKEPGYEQVSMENDQIKPEESKLQLVFLGDSIFDRNRDGSGIPYLTAKQCDAGLYNLAIGGTSASIEEGEKSENEAWTSRSLCGVVKAINKEIPTDIFAGSNAKEILDDPNVDFSQTDYFIVEYGTNDFFRAVPQSKDDYYNMWSYGGALRYAVSNLTECAPDATIILCSPCYAQFYDGNWMIGDGNVVNNGEGTLFDYVGTCNCVANENNALFLNAYLDLGINGYTAEEYLEDGVHLTEAGRRLYAEALAKMILRHEETKNN